MNRTSFFKILIISFGDLDRDPRINRQIMFLMDKYEISTMGTKSTENEKLAFYPIERKSTSFINKVIKALFCKFKMYEKVYWNDYKFDILLNKLRGKRFDLVISNDIEPLPFALKISNGAKIVLDAHEYIPLEFEGRFLWKFFLQGYKGYLCKQYIKYCDRMTTVSNGLAGEYFKNFDVKPIVITNACDYIDIKPSLTEKQRIKLIHHGIASSTRKLEIMIEMADYLDKRFCLDIMLVNTNSNYYRFLKNLAKDKNNIKFIPPVPMKEIVEFTNQYDIGLFILRNDLTTYKYALPNKFFEFVNARLAVAIGPSPEMAKIVKQFDCGIVAEDFEPETMAKVLNKLTKDKIDYYKSQSNIAAKELSSEKNCQKLNSLVTSLIKHDRL